MLLKNKIYNPAWNLWLVWRNLMFRFFVWKPAQSDPEAAVPSEMFMCDCVFKACYRMFSSLISSHTIFEPAFKYCRSFPGLFQVFPRSFPGLSRSFQGLWVFLLFPGWIQMELITTAASKVIAVSSCLRSITLPSTLTLWSSVGLISDPGESEKLRLSKTSFYSESQLLDHVTCFQHKSSF